MIYLHAIDLDVLFLVFIHLSQDKLLTTKLERPVWIIIGCDADCEDMHTANASTIVGSLQCDFNILVKKNSIFYNPEILTTENVC